MHEISLSLIQLGRKIAMRIPLKKLNLQSTNTLVHLSGTGAYVKIIHSAQLAYEWLKPCLSVAATSASCFDMHLAPHLSKRYARERITHYQ